LYRERDRDVVIVYKWRSAFPTSMAEKTIFYPMHGFGTFVQNVVAVPLLVSFLVV
jgi:hypothetical protein